MNAEWKIKGIFNADAQRVADEIGENRITPEQILEKARDVNSELHKCFEWNDSIAAEKYRLQQARSIILNLVYVPKKDDERLVRCFELTTERKTYQPTHMFLKQEDEYQALLKRAYEEFRALKKKYAMLTELEKVFEEIEQL